MILILDNELYINHPFLRRGTDVPCCSLYWWIDHTYELWKYDMDMYYDNITV